MLATSAKQTQDGHHAADDGESLDEHRAVDACFSRSNGRRDFGADSNQSSVQYCLRYGITMVGCRGDGTGNGISVAAVDAGLRQTGP